MEGSTTYIELPPEYNQHQSFISQQSPSPQKLHEIMMKNNEIIIEELTEPETINLNDAPAETGTPQLMSGMVMIPKTPSSIHQSYVSNLTAAQLEILDKIKEGEGNDSKFVYKLLMLLFDKETLVNSSITGRPSKNGKYNFRGSNILDKGKLSFCKSE